MPDQLTEAERLAYDEAIDQEALLERHAETLSPLEEARIMEEKELVSAMAQFAGDSGAKLYIYRVDGADQRSGEFIESFAAFDMSHDELMNRLRDVHYGGRFKIQIRNKAGHIQLNQIVSTIKTEPPVEVEKDAGADNFAHVLMAMQAQQAEARKDSQDMMMRMNQMQAESQQQNMQTMMTMITSMSNNKPEAPAFGPMEMVTLMGTMQGMFKDDSPKTDPIEMLVKGMEMGREQGGGDENIAQTLVKTMAPALAGMGQMMGATPAMAQPVQAPLPVEAIPAPMPTPTPPPAPAPAEDKEQMLMLKFQAFKPYLDSLIIAAQQDANPEVYANYLLDQLDVDTVETVLAAENYEKLYQYLPHILPLKQWLDRCRDLTLECILEMQNEDEAGNEGELIPEAPAEPEPEALTDGPEENTDPSNDHSAS